MDLFEQMEARIPHGEVRTRFAPSPTGSMHGGNLRTAAGMLRGERLDRVGGAAQDDGKALIGGKRRRHAFEHDLGGVVTAHGIHCDGDVVCHVDTLSLAGVARRADGAAKRKKASLRQWRRREASSCNCTL